MQVWLFQANEYDLTKEISTRLGDYWEVRNYNGLEAQDKAILWQSGPDAGVYAIGDLVSNAGQTKDGKWHVDIRYTPLLEPPVLKRDLLKHPVLRDLLVIRMPGRGNAMRVTPKEWQALEKLISREP